MFVDAFYVLICFVRFSSRIRLKFIEPKTSDTEGRVTESHENGQSQKQDVRYDAAHYISRTIAARVVEL